MVGHGFPCINGQFIHETLFTKHQSVLSATTMLIIFWDFLMVEQIFLPPQVWLTKRDYMQWTGIYKLPHKLPNDLRD